MLLWKRFWELSPKFVIEITWPKLRANTKHSLTEETHRKKTFLNFIQPSRQMAIIIIIIIIIKQKERQALKPC